MQKRRSKYLYQLIVTSCVLVVVPTVFFFVFFWTKAFNEMKRLDSEYNSKMSRLFCGTFVDVASQLKNHALVFSECSKDSSSGLDAFYEGTQKMIENPYYYWEACEELGEYSQKATVDYLAVYYYGKDVVLTHKYKYTVDRFFKEELSIESSDNAQYTRLLKCFEQSSYKQPKILYEPIYDIKGNFKELLMGVCIELGKSKEPGLLLFKLDKSDFDFFYLSTLGNEWEKYYVLDSGTQELLFVLGDEGVMNFEVLKKIAEYESSTENLFVTENERMELTFILDVSVNVTQNNIFKFYRDMRVLIVYIVLFMIFIGCMAVYYNYKPVYNLLTVTKSKGKNEFDTIYFELNEKNMLLSEQRMLIMDLIINRLIYGIPISEEHIDKLGVSEKVTSYCVFLVENYILNSGQVAQVMNAAEEEFSMLLFVTDLQGEKSTVMIAFLENTNEKMIGDWLEGWCSSHIQEEYLLLRGSAVNNINDIQKSLKLCKENDAYQMLSHQSLSERKLVDNVMEQSETSERLKQDVVKYLEEHFKDEDLSQTKVADFCHISVYTLSRLFKNQIKIGFTEYVNGKRFEYAKELLLTTQLSVKEIASMVGINDANYFTRVFRQYVGESPTTFRKASKSD